MATEESAKTVGPFTEEQLASARQVYEGLEGLFGKKTGGAEAKLPQVGVSHKTFADVTDKALDMFGTGVAQIAATTEKAAPVVWAIMVKQQIASAVANVIGPVISLVGTYILHFIILKSFGDNVMGDTLVWKIALSYVIPIIAAVGCSIWFIVAIMQSLQQLVNPAYFAVKDLVGLITGRPSSPSGGGVQ